MSAVPATPGRPAPLRASGWTSPVFLRVAEIVNLVAGNVFPPNRQPSAESGMRRVMSAYHLRDPEALLAAVSQAGDVRDALLAELTVGESYFFRESVALELLESAVLPTARRRGAGGRPLRIWSAGCATGEEPYSVAIRLRELGYEGPAEITATDISRPRLESARRGRYTRWALRGVAEERVDRWFERRGPHYLLDAGIRGDVDFRDLNLVGGDYPLADTGGGQDLVLCRNVLIYFDMQSIREIAARLLASLQPDGWLLLGASDPPIAELVPCRLVMLPSGAAYQRADGVERVPRPRAARPALPLQAVPGVLEREHLPAPPAPAAEPPLALVAAAPAPAPPPASADAAEAAYAAYARADYRAAESLARAAIDAAPGAAAGWIVAIRSLANLGQLDAAGEMSARALEVHRMSVELHYLHAMLLLEAGHAGPAAQAVRRALYLDARFVVGYMLLGDALDRLGDRDGACRAFGNARALLAPPRDDAEPLLASDGVPSRRVQQIVAQRLHSLGCAS